jgi:agmatinase
MRVLIPVSKRLSGARRHHHPDPMNMKVTKGWKAALKEATLPHTRHDEEAKRVLKMGLQGASSINDKSIPTFSRGELPHFAGINVSNERSECDVHMEREECMQR